MDRRGVLKIAGTTIIGAMAVRSLAVAATKKDHPMSFDRKTIENLAAAYTSAWNTGSPQNVAAYFAEDGEIIINRGSRGEDVRVSPRWRRDFSPTFWA